MPKVQLSREEAEDGHLPEICMQCGAQAWKQWPKAFSWYPPWVGVLILGGVLPFVIVAAVLTKRMTVRAPLCDEHLNHWSWRAWFVGLSVAVFIVLGIACIVLLSAQDNRQGGDRKSVVEGK